MFFKQTVEGINGRGLANGWHALQLMAKAKRLGRTMSQLFKESTEHSSAFSVPAKCIGLNSHWIDYEFIDGSKLTLPNPNSQ